MRKLLFSALGALCFGFGGPTPPDRPAISMVFTDTDVAQVFKAISLRTGATIIYAGKEKLTVSLDATVHSAEEAIRDVAAASGLVYRKIDGTFVVASPAALKQALEPYGYTAYYTLDPGLSSKGATEIQEALPYTTTRAVGDRVEVIGTLDDIREAGRLAKEIQHDADESKMASATVTLRHMSGDTVTQVLKDLNPNSKVSGTTDKTVGGIYIITAPAKDLPNLVSTFERLDSGPDNEHFTDIVYRVYQLRYIGGVTLTQFLKTAVPEVTAILGPEDYSPPRAIFNPLTSTLENDISSSSVGGSSTNGTSGTNSGQTGTTNTTATQVLSQDHKWQVGDRAKTVVLEGRADVVENALRLIRTLDVKPRQVVVEAKVFETSPSFEENLGINWNLANTLTVTETPPSQGIGFGSFTRSPISVSAAISAAVTKGDAKILATPHIEVTENDDADIFIGDTIRTQLAQANGLGGETISIAEFPIGILLLLRAHLNPDGNITMHVNPVVSTVTSVDTNGIPQTASREAETNVIIKDGETIVIGGLIREDDSKTINEVPFLSQLPIVGELFRSHSISKMRTNVIVTITPHIVPDPEADK